METLRLVETISNRNPLILAYKYIEFWCERGIPQTLLEEEALLYLKELGIAPIEE
jgi:hypothetical protein